MKDQILAAALSLAAQRGYTNVTRDAVAHRVKAAPSLVNYYFKTMKVFRRQLMRHAIRKGDLCVVAQGLIARDVHALKAPADLRARAIANIQGPQ